MTLTTYQRIAKAIEYLQQHYIEQPSLAVLASAAGLSPSHFQRLFHEWAGVSPKKFVQFLSIEHAKRMLASEETSILDTAYAIGLSGSGRLHDLFVSIEGMTPGEFRNGGERLAIHYCFEETPFGLIVAAATAKGVCHLAFSDDRDKSLAFLLEQFPNANFRQAENRHTDAALTFFRQDWSQPAEVKLHLKGTPFQLKVWDSLLRIPEGRLATYGTLARQIGQPTAARAVGGAIGSNPIAVLIPCHRVIQGSGQFGGYRWGAVRKSALIGWEAARRSHDS